MFFYKTFLLFLFLQLTFYQTLWHAHCTCSSRGKCFSTFFFCFVSDKNLLVFSFLFLQCDSHVGIVFLIITCFAKHEVVSNDELWQTMRNVNVLSRQSRVFYSHTHSKTLNEHHACKWGWPKIVHMVIFVKHILINLITKHTLLTNIQTHNFLIRLLQLKTGLYCI